MRALWPHRVQDLFVAEFVHGMSGVGLAPFPLDHHNITCGAARMKDDAYRSCAQSFSAAQQRKLRQPVSGLLQGLIRDFKRSVLCGLGPEQLKDSFDVWALRPLLQASSNQVGAWDANDMNSMTDAVLLCSKLILGDRAVQSSSRSCLSGRTADFVALGRL